MALKCQLCGSVRGWGNEVAGEPLDAANGVMATLTVPWSRPSSCWGRQHRGVLQSGAEAAEELLQVPRARQAHQIQIDIWGPHWTGESLSPISPFAHIVALHLVGPKTAASS